jgi:L-amino acid N-acyltransferase YncA
MTDPDIKGAIVRSARPEDAEAVAAIYNHYVAQTVVTFEEEAVSASEISQRLEDVHRASLPWLVGERDGLVVGYAYATRWRSRRAYRFSAEVTVYVHPDHSGTGIGTALYGQLLVELRNGGIHAAMGGIALPNDASVRLHEKFNFKKVAHFEAVGFKFNRWIDVGYWQVVL